MFFRKKNEELSDQLAKFQEREDPRYALTAGIFIEGFEGEGMLDNISISGCCMESITYVALIPDQEYQVNIHPDGDVKMEPFTLMLKLNWTKSSETLFQAGFSLGSGESNAKIKQYVELLRARGIQPDYGNMSPERRESSK
jgi:hypothetical protein